MMKLEPTELHRKFRPKSLDNVLGQDEAIAAIKDKLETGTLPQVILLHSPSGSGKTALAHIIMQEIGVEESHLEEINCADARDIDTVRSIIREAMSPALGQKKRGWILDEAVQIPKASQQAFLKLLESPPTGVYLIFCTSDMKDLLTTFVSRCWMPPLKPLTSKIIDKIVANACCKLGITLSLPVFNGIISKSDGNARQALQILETVCSLSEEAEQLMAIGLAGATVQEKSDFLAKLLIKRSPWAALQKCLKSIPSEQAESASYRLLAYADAIMVNSTTPADIDMASMMVVGFSQDFRKSQRAGLSAATWEIFRVYAKKA